MQLGFNAALSTGTADETWNFEEVFQRIKLILDNQGVQVAINWVQDNRIVLSALGAFVVGLLIARRRPSHTPTFQTSGEALVARVLARNFAAPDYHLMNHVTLQLMDGTTEVDHILVSRFGIFVIETKDYKGWIFADAASTKWTQVLFRMKFRFQNPIHQNFRHVRAVQRLLDFLPRDAIRSLVVFTGAAEFKTAVPDGVFRVSNLVEYLREQTTEVMSLNRMQFCVGRLETSRLAISRMTDVEHVQNLQRRHGGSL